MIKSTFSHNGTKLPLSCSSKKPSLASLAQKLQRVDLNSTSHTECTLSGSGLNNPVSFTDVGKYTRTSALDSNTEDHCSSSTKLTPDSVEGRDQLFLSPASQPISSCDNGSNVCFSKADRNEGIGKCNESGTDSSDLLPSGNDTSSELGRLHISSRQKRCKFAKPTPFGRTLSAVPKRLNRPVQHQKKCALYARFSYYNQTAAAAVGMQRQHYSSTSTGQTIRPFDFSTPSPDDIVRQKQKLAFGTSTKQ